jgi:hypothetical protein
MLVLVETLDGCQRWLDVPKAMDKIKLPLIQPMIKLPSPVECSVSFPTRCYELVQQYETHAVYREVLQGT